MNCSGLVDVIIVNWNAGELLRNAIDSLKSHGGKELGRVVVVDNGSTDGSLDLVVNASDVLLIKAGENLGFGKACNLGAKSCSSDYLLFLNPDATLYPDTLTKVLDFMQKPANATVGICGIQLIDESGHIARSCARFPSPFVFVLHAVGVDRFFPRLGQFMAEWDHKENREVDQVIGAFFLVRREVYDALGGFDERFFVYFEEVDFSFRALKAGWRSFYLAGAQAFHAGCGTSNQVKGRRLFYFLRSRLLYSFKHFSIAGATLALMMTLLIEPLSRSLLTIVRRSWRGFSETWSAYVMLLRWLLQWLLERTTR